MKSIIPFILLLLCHTFAFCETSADRISCYFDDDFDSHSIESSLNAQKAGAGGQWFVLGEPTKLGGKIDVTTERTACKQSKQSLQFLRPLQKSQLPALSARLRLPYRREAYASMDIFFDKKFLGKTNTLTLALSQPNASRIARLIMEQAAGSDIVTLKLEDGIDAKNMRTIGTMLAEEWHKIVWGNDAGSNTVTLILDGKVLLNASSVVPQSRTRERMYENGSVSQLVFYPHQAGNIYIDNLKVYAQNPLKPKQNVAAVNNHATEQKDAVMCIDFFDLGYFDALMNHHIYDVKQIRELLTACKKAGIKTVLWRLSACGSAVYQSKVENYDTFGRDRRVPAHAVVDILDRYNPLWEACKIGHELGLKVFAWITLYDDGVIGTPHYSKLLLKHPEYQWVDREGKNYLQGVPSYAFAETRKFRVNMIKEVVTYPVDGLFLSFRTHSVVNPSYKDNNIKEFGYETPVVEEYKKRYGVDIRKSDFNRKKWHELKGEYFTELLREIRGVIHREMPVWICLVSTYGDGPTSKTQHALDYKTWHDENLVQGIVVCGPRIQQGKADESSGKLIPIQPEIIKKYSLLRKMGFKLYYFASVDQREKCEWGYIAEILNNLKNTPFQGITIMEGYRFQLGDHRWPSKK